MISVLNVFVVTPFITETTPRKQHTFIPRKQNPNCSTDLVRPIQLIPRKQRIPSNIQRSWFNSSQKSNCHPRGQHTEKPIQIIPRKQLIHRKQHTWCTGKPIHLHIRYFQLP